MIYIFKHPNKEKYKEVNLPIDSKKEFFDKDGLKWERVYTSPQLSVSTKIDAFSEKQFLEKTKNSKGNFGDLLDRSKEMSLKREEKLGKDPIREKFFKDYSKKRKNKKHFLDPSMKKTVSKNGISISL